MTIRHALFIDGAWIDGGGDSFSALVTVDEIGIEIKPYSDAEIIDMVRFSFEELAAIVEMVARARQGPQP
jgi:hypothetical protein